jgi:hypothetical protein
VHDPLHADRPRSGNVTRDVVHEDGLRWFQAQPRAVQLAAGIIAGIGNLTIKFTSTFSITGIAAGTLIVIIGYHGVKVAGAKA